MCSVNTTFTDCFIPISFGVYQSKKKIFSLRTLMGKMQRPSKFWIVPDGPNLKRDVIKMAV